MAVHEQAGDRIVLRVVYDGPGLVGKTTNLEQLAQAFHGEHVPDPPDTTPLARNQPAANRTRFFDWFAFDGGKLDGHNLRIQVVGVPGHKRFEARRAALLRSADAIVLVCDSTPAAQESTRETLDSMREHLGALASQIPLIVQANKQDLPHALQPGELGNALGLPLEVPLLGAQASGGLGVRETVVQAVRTAVRRIKRQITRHGLSALAGHAQDADMLRAELARLLSPALPEDGPKEPLTARRRPAQRLTIVNEPKVVQIGTAKTGKLGSRTRHTPQSEPREGAPQPGLFYDEDPASRPVRPTNTPASTRVTVPATTDKSTAELPREGELSPATLHALVELATAPHNNLSPGTEPPSPPDLSPGTASKPRNDPGKPAAPPAKQARRPRTRGPAVVPSLPATPTTPLVLPPPPRRNAPAAKPAEPSSKSALPFKLPAGPAYTIPKSLAAPATPKSAEPPGDPSTTQPSTSAPAFAAPRPSNKNSEPPASSPPTSPRPNSEPPAPSPPSPRPNKNSEPPAPLPPLPRADVPTGHVWPIPRGRDVLRALADAPVETLPAPPRPSASPPVLLAVGDWRLCTRDDQRHPSIEQALLALRTRVRHTMLCAPLLASDLVLVVQPEPSDHARLWHIVPRLDGIREHLALRPPQTRPRLLAALAAAIAGALRVWLRHGLALELDLGAFAIEAGRVVHLGDRIDERPRDVGIALLGFCERLSGDAAALSAFTAALEQELGEFTPDERTRLDLEPALVRAETRYQDAHVARNRLLAALRASP